MVYAGTSGSCVAIACFLLTKLCVIKTEFFPIVSVSTDSLYGCVLDNHIIRNFWLVKTFLLLRLTISHIHKSWKHISALPPPPSTAAHCYYCRPAKDSWAGHVARVGGRRDVYRVLLGKPEGKRPLGRPRRKWGDNIKMDLQKVGCGG